MKRRIMSFVLAVAFVFSALPTNAFALDAVMSTVVSDAEGDMEREFTVTARYEPFVLPDNATLSISEKRTEEDLLPVSDWIQAWLDETNTYDVMAISDVRLFVPAFFDGNGEEVFPLDGNKVEYTLLFPDGILTSSCTYAICAVPTEGEPVMLEDVQCDAERGTILFSIDGASQFALVVLTDSLIADDVTEDADGEFDETVTERTIDEDSFESSEPVSDETEPETGTLPEEEPEPISEELTEAPSNVAETDSTELPAMEVEGEAVTEEAMLSVTSSGACGDHLSWVLDDEGTLTISGSGAMTGFSIDDSPWFENRNRIKSVVIEQGVTTIGDNAFRSCALTEVTIPDSVRSVGRESFAWCTNLTSISIPDNVTWIGFAALFHCENLSAVKLSASIREIENYMFYGCNSLTSIIIPDSVSYVGQSSFESCINLSNVSIPHSVTTIDSNAFDDCVSLDNVTIPDSVSRIGGCAFRGCTSLTTVFIPESVEILADDAFVCCDSLLNIAVDENNKTYSSVDGVLYNKRQSELIAYPSGKTGSFIIPDGVETILNTTFYHCNSLTAVTIPESVTTIGLQAFDSCNSLHTVTILGNVSGIGMDSFNNCGELSEISFYGDAPSFDGGCFYGVEATAFYPANNPTWTDAVRQDYGGRIEWTPLQEEGSAEIVASGTCGTNLDWALDAIGLLTISGTGRMGDYDYNTVPWKAEKNNIKGAVIQQGVTSIGSYAFSYCSNLTNVDIPNSVTCIENDAFWCCTSLTSVTIPDSVTRIGSSAFGQCIAMTSISLGNGVTCLEQWAFYDCDNLTGISIPDSVTTIGYCCFEDCSSLTDVKIGTGVTSIGSDAFIRTPWLAAQGDCLTINDILVYYNSAATEIVIPNGVTTIAEGALMDCNNLLSLTIPASVTSIGYCLNWNCQNTIIYGYPDSAAESFAAEYNLTFSSLDPSNPFTGGSCGENVSWRLTNDGTLTISGSGAMGSYDWNRPFWAGQEALIRTVVIEQGVTSIGEGAFNNCTALSSVSLPDTLLSIGDWAFCYCTNLTELTIPDGVTTIGGYLFGDCTSLASVTIPASVTTIGYDLFWNCPNTMICGYPDTAAEQYACENHVLFSSLDPADPYYSGCCGESVIWKLRGGTLTVSGSGAMSDNPWDWEHPYWHGLEESIQSVVVESGVTRIGDCSFAACRNLSSVTLADTVTTIGSWAFGDCNNLSGLDLGNGVTTICDGAFYNCTGLTRFEVPSTVTSLGSYVFGNCSGLTEVILPDTIISIPSSLFSNCDNLNTVVIPDSVTTIERDAFYYCSNLTDITIPDSVTTIESYAFADCYGLTDILIPGNVTAIGECAFWYCTNLTTICFSGDAPSIGTDCFKGVTAAAVYPAENDTWTPEVWQNYGGSLTWTLEVGRPELTALAVNGGETVIGYCDAELTASITAHGSYQASGQFYYQSGDTEPVAIGDAITLKSRQGDFSLQQNWEIQELPSGTYTVLFVLTDEEGEFGSESVTIQIDNSVPAQIVGVTATGALRSISLSWSVAAELSTVGYRIYQKGPAEQSFRLLTEITKRNTLSYEDTVPVGQADYSYYVTGVNRFGRESEPSQIVSAATQLDTEPPQIQRLTPAANTVLSGQRTVSATAVDNDSVARTALYWRLPGGESSLIAESEGASVTGTIDTTQMSDGNIQIYAFAWDLTGNVSNGQPVYNCSVDNTPPEPVTNLTASSTATVITLAWDYEPPEDFHHFVVEESGDSGFRQIATVYNTLGVNLTGLIPESSHTYRVRCVDTVGNTSQPSETITASTAADTTAPVVSAIQPGAGYRNTNFDVTFTLKDNYAVVSVQVQVSRDRVNWETVAEQTFDTPAATKTLSHSVRMADYPEDGSLYLRAIPVDVSGNRGDSGNDTAPFVEYILDRTAPAVPQNVTVQTQNLGVYLQWDNDPAGETVSYRLLRNETENGQYRVIASNLHAISYYDRGAQADRTYWYRIQGLDAAGNISEGSAPVSGSWTNTTDNQPPEILSFSPSDGQSLGGTNRTVSVLAQDERILSRIEITYSKVGLLGTLSQERSLTLESNGGYYLSGSRTLDLTGYETGDTLRLSVTAYDANNNASQTLERTYSIDLTAPTVEQFTAVLEGNSVNLSWQAGADCADLNGFYIYRSNGVNWTRIGSRAAREEGSYTLTDYLSANGTYTYRIAAVDLIGNEASYFSDSVTLNTPRLSADFSTDLKQQTEVEYLFDASASSGTRTIAAWRFDFGDGTTGEGRQCIHVYQQTGTYTVTLTVEDEGGLTAQMQRQVEVQERAALGTLCVKVVDDSGVPVGSAPVYFDLGEETQVIRATDGQGIARFTGTAGAHVVGAYLDGYLPVTKQAILSSNTEKSVELIMVHQPIVTGSFEVSRMTLEEIRAANIDVSDPANQNCATVMVHLTYGSQDVSLNCAFNTVGQLVSGSNTTVIEDRQLIVQPIGDSSFHIEGGSGGGTGGSGTDLTSLMGSGKIVAILDIPAQASCLKEFFDVKLHILNQASEEFVLTDNVLSLNVPEGMTLMEQSENTALEHRPSLRGQDTWTLSWILRGDTAGDYSVSADYSAILSDFNAGVSATFQTQEPIKVYGMSALKLVVTVNKSIAYGGLYFDLGIQNIGGADLYLPSVDVLERIIYCFENKIQDTLDTTEFFRQVTVRNTTLSNSSGFVQYLGKFGSVDVLSPGEMLTRQYLLYGAVTETDLTRIREAVYEVLEGTGIEVEIRVADMDLFSRLNAEEKVLDIFTDDYRQSVYDIIMDHGNYFYFQQACRDECFDTLLGQTYYAVANAVISLNFDRISNETERDVTRQFIYELLEDESFQQAVDLSIDTKYLRITEHILSNITDILASNTSDQLSYDINLDDLNAVLGETKNIKNLSAALREGGAEGFNDRLQTLLFSSIGAVGAKYVQERLERDGFLIESFNEGSMGVLNCVSSELKQQLSTVSDILGTVDTVVTAWNTASQINRQFITIDAAHEQALFLVESILEDDRLAPSMREELERIHAGLIDGFKNQQELFVDQIQVDVMQGAFADKVVNGLFVGTIDKIFFSEAAYGVGTVLKTLRLTYSMADYLFGWSETADVYASLKVAGYLSIALERSTRNYRTSDPVAFLNSLKYMIKMRLVGERMYVRLLTEYHGANGEYQADQALQAINEDRNTNYASLNDYYIHFREQMLTRRDALYQERTTIVERPEAPTVTFDYLNSRTVQTFGADFEYSLDGDSWTVCGSNGVPDYIYIEGKQTGQRLWVRGRETVATLTGESTVLTLTAMPEQRYATKAGSVESTCMVWGLEPMANYEILRTDTSDTEGLDWSAAFPAATDGAGVLTVQLEGGDYLIYRRPAAADRFPSVAHSIYLSRDLLVRISAETQGNGRVLCAGEVFQDQILINGAEVTLNVDYNAETDAFWGWFVNGQLYSKQETVELEATDSVHLTARFEAKPDVSNANVSVSDQSYTGNTLTPPVTVMLNGASLVESIDYTVSYSDNTNAGTATVTITGKGNYIGTATKTFKILAYNLDGASVTPASIRETYSGNAITPDVTVRMGDKVLANSTDYTITYANNVNAGNASITVTGKGNYSGTACGYFTIAKAGITPKVTINGWIYGNPAQNPNVTGNTGNGKVTYTYAKKGTTSFSATKPTTAGSYTVKAVIASTDNYNAATATADFTIDKAAQTAAVTAPSSVVKGKTVTVTAKAFGTVSYTSSNTKIATVTAKGVVKGIAPGTVTITVKAAGNANYNAASTTVKITVNLPTPNVTKVENVNGGVKITVGKVTGAAKYRLFYKTGKGKWTKLTDITSTTYTWKKAKSATTYTFTVRCISKDGKAFTSDYNTTGKSILYLAAPTLANSAAKTMKVTWKSASGVTGYQVSYATSSKFSGAKSVTVKNAKTLTTTIKNLKKGTTYYVRLRTYTTKSGKTTFSTWSGVKSIKISK